MNIHARPTLNLLSPTYLHIKVLTQQLLLTEGVSGLPCDHVHWTLLKLTLDGSEEDEHGLANMLLWGVGGRRRGGRPEEEGEGEGGEEEEEGRMGRKDEGGEDDGGGRGEEG